MLSCLTFFPISKGHTKHLGEATLHDGVADKVGEFLSARTVTCFVYEACINWKKSSFFTVCVYV